MLDRGKVALSGTAPAAAKDSRVQAVYLGGSAAGTLRRTRPEG